MMLMLAITNPTDIVDAPDFKDADTMIVGEDVA